MAGITESVSTSVEHNPPSTTVASGRCISEPMPVASAAGAMPSIATTIRIKICRNWIRAPSTTASLRGNPFWRRCRFICEMYSTPLITATPNREMKPTAAETLKLMPRR